MTSGISAEGTSQYLKRIKNETDRIKRRRTHRSYDDDERGAEQPPPVRHHQQKQQPPSPQVDTEPSLHEGHDSLFPSQLVDQRGESVSFEDDKCFHDPVPKRNMSNHLQAQHEAFKLRLVDEVLGNDAGDKVPMEKVVMLIWQYRDDPQVVKFMTRFVAKVRRSFALTNDGVSPSQRYQTILNYCSEFFLHLAVRWFP
jgi:hypothetical protein